MTGTIVLYSGNKRLSTHYYFSRYDRDDIFEKWRNEWKELYENFNYHIIPDIEEEKVINTEKGVINKKRVVTNIPLRDIQMPDFTPVGFGRHESYYHSCYCKGEK